MLSITDEILIYLEDKGEQEINSLPFKNKRKYKGGIGRLEVQKLVKRRKSNNQSYISLTVEGNKFIDKVLNTIHQSKPSWKEIYLIAFSISEKQRRLRDILRRRLVALGAKMLVSSLWISASDISSEVEKLSKNFGISDQIFVLKSSPGENVMRKIFTKIYNPETITRMYQTFLKNTNQYLRKNKTDSFEAKKLIYEYAKILKLDPLLPENFSSESKYRKQAHELYQKLRSAIS